MLGKLTGQEEPDGGLDLPGGDGGPLVVVGELAGLGGDPLEQVVDERVHDGHGLRRDPSVWMNLLQDLRKSNRDAATNGTIVLNNETLLFET